MSPRKLVVTVLVAALALLGLAWPSSAVPVRAAPVQTLTWTAGNSTDHYLSAPATAVAGRRWSCSRTPKPSARR